MLVHAGYQPVQGSAQRVRYGLISVGAASQLLDEEIDRELEGSSLDADDVRAAQARLDEARLVDDILATGFDGQSYQQLSDDLWLYSFPVMKVLIRTGKITALVRRHAPTRVFTMHPEDQAVLAKSVEERDALAVDVIIKALADFKRNALGKRGWDPAGGASLRTYFIGTCALNFPDAYHAWSARRAERLDKIAHAHKVDLSRLGEQVGTLADPYEAAATRDIARRIVKEAPPATKLILGLILQDLTMAQIAAELGLTERAVEGRLYRLRRRVIGESKYFTRLAQSSQNLDIFHDDVVSSA